MNSNRYSKKTRLIHISILSVLIISFFSFNLFTITQKDIFVDESISYFLVNTLSYEEILMGVDVHPPIYYVLIKSLPHDNIFTLRIYSLIIMISAIILLASIMYHEFSFKHSLVITLFTTLSMTISHYAIEVRMYALLFLFSVFIFKYMLERNHKLALTFIILSVLTHYYAVFLFIPYVISLFIYDINYQKKSLSESLKRVRIIVLVFLFLMLVLSPYILHQFRDNPYKILPPKSVSTMISIPSMIIFPFLLASEVKSLPIIFYSFIVVIIIILLMIISKRIMLSNYCIISFFTALLMLLLNFIFNIPYHHRYLFIFFPQIYFMIVDSLNHLKRGTIITSVILILLLITTVQYHVDPPNDLLELSQSIKCPKNILHETPFSFLPMRLYLPNCNHYLYITKDFMGVTHKTVYTTPKYINNMDVEYDLYIHNFDELLAEPILIKSNDVELIRLG